MARPALIEMLMQAGKILFKPSLIPVDDKTLVRNDDNIGVALSYLVKSGGGLAVDETGKMYVNFDAMPGEQLEAVVLAMVQDGGGIAVDSNGQLYVDFESMPTDKFEAMLKSIRVPIWLTGNKSFYVNGTTGADTLDTGRGESESKPFKTINAAIQYVANNYNLGPYAAYIEIASGTYDENIELPKYNATTGYIYIKNATDNVDNVILLGGIRAQASVGRYYIQSIKIRNKEGVSSLGTSVNFYGLIVYEGNNIRVIHCKFELINNPPDGGDVHAIYSSGASVELRDIAENDYAIYVTNKLETDTEETIRPTLGYLLRVTGGGTINIMGDIHAYCSADTFVGALRLGLVEVSVPTGRDTPKCVGSVIGTRYNVVSNGVIDTHGRGTEFFLGDVAGGTGSGGQYL